VRYRFGQFELDAARYELTHAGTVLAVRPKVFELLRYLIERPDRLVTHRELLADLWSGQHVAETAVPWTVRQARKVLRQKNGERGPIETVHARGYRWRGAIETLDDSRVAQPAPTSVDTPFVGRWTLLPALREVIAKARSGRGGLLLVTGDAGIGKTRCMEELAHAAQGNGYTVWRGRCLPEAMAPVYSPFCQALRGAQVEPRLQSQLTALLQRLDAAQPAQPLDERSAVRSRLVLFEAVSRFLSEQVRSHPLLLTLDDLHWADSGTLELLSYLAAELRHSRVVILAASRTPLTAASSRGAEAFRHAHRYELEPLNAAEVSEYWRVTLGQGEPSAVLRDALHRVSAGYPLFLEETLRDLLARHPPSALPALDASQLAPSQHARELLHARVAALPDATREALACASVLGEAFELAELVQLSGLAPDALLRALDSALCSGLVRPCEGERLEFRHALFRETVYEELPLSRRLQLHRAVAVSLEARPDAFGRRSEIAQHYYRSLALGGPAKVYAAAFEAARVASGAPSYADAAQFAAWALEALRSDPTASPRDHTELLLFQAYAQRSAGSPDDARETLASAVQLAVTHGFADLLVRSARALRLSHGVGFVPDALARRALEHVLQLSVDDHDALRIQATSMLAWLPPDSYDMSLSKRRSEQALLLARDSGSSAALAEAHTARLYGLSGPDDIAELLALTDHILGAEPSLWLRIEALAAKHTALLHRGDAAYAEATLDTLRELANLHGFLDIRWHCDRHRVQSRIARGDFATANAALSQLEADALHLRLGSGAGLVAMLRGLIASATQAPSTTSLPGDLSRYRDRVGAATFRSTLQSSLLRQALQHGAREQAARGLAALAADDFAQVPKNLGYLCSLCHLAQVAIALAERAHALRLYTLLVPYAQLGTPNELAVCDGPVAYTLALLAAFLERDAEAAHHFAAAIAQLERLGRKPQLARALLEHAGFELRRGSQRVARTLAARAAELGEALGMHWLHHDARAV
jgi:DNA-binding winged helix-turn-helix (wHTH) protein